LIALPLSGCRSASAREVDPVSAWAKDSTPPTFPNAPEVVNATGTSCADIGGHDAAAPYFETI